jgi:hypothetical protein
MPGRPSKRIADQLISHRSPQRVLIVIKATERQSWPDSDMNSTDRRAGDSGVSGLALYIVADNFDVI